MTTFDALLRKLDADQITWRQAAEELHRCGTYNYVPSEEQTRNTLERWQTICAALKH